MSIGIVITLPDGALLVADGRRTLPLADDKKPVNSIDKIEKLADTLYAIPFGVTQVTDYTLSRLRTDQQYKTPEELSFQMETIVQVGWSDLWQGLAPDVDRQHPALKAGILAGGILNGEFFSAGSLCGNQGNTPPTLHKQPWHVVVLGGEKQGASALLIHAMSTIIQGRTWDYRTGPISDIVQAILDVSVSVIRYVATQDDSVGGIIRFAVVRNNYSSQKGIIGQIDAA